MRKNKAQNLIEFLLIVALVAIGGIFALTMLGGNAYNLFASSAEKQAGFDPFNVKNSSASTTPVSGGSSVTVVSSETIDGYNVDRNSDGSVSFIVKDQAVNIKAEDLALLDTVFETSGSDGIELIKAIAKMIEDNKVEGGLDIPIEISFGQGARSVSTMVQSTDYIGTASVNTTVIKSGSNVTIIQKDQDCVSTGPNTCNFSGIYTIEGNINNDNFTSTSVSATILEGYYAGQTYSGSYTGTVNSTDGLSFAGTYHIDYPGTALYKWDIDFSSLKSL